MAPKLREDATYGATGSTRVTSSRSTLLFQILEHGAEPNWQMPEPDADGQKHRVANRGGNDRRRRLAEADRQTLDIELC